MAKREFCSINNMKPSQRTIDYIEKMNDIVDMASLLDNVIKTVPFFHIFAGRRSYSGVAISSASYSATTYQWTLYYEAVSSVDEVRRTRLEQVALQAALEMHGEERKFWECIYNAL